ncbi:hypothetical protein GCM10025876_38320 [Demequina litorisediminis]|uniref:Uncharacterized protein n=1 Tax=Demequina litorisediminis TaxID=1849022 RepID=A0ABQ6II96_9MICO|nr:hypothetical protein GCM10025876_38320 [Demequina litorisediminis]
MARSMRRVMRYEYGLSPYASRNCREKCPADMPTPAAIRLDVQREGVLAIHAVPGAAQEREIAQALLTRGGHAVIVARMVAP